MGLKVCTPNYLNTAQVWLQPPYRLCYSCAALECGGRNDVDSRGWIGYYTRCDAGDEAMAVLRTHDSDDNLTLAVACDTGSGYKYYRGLNGSNPIEMEIIVDEGDRIVGRNGAWKYQMSPSSLLITQNNVVQHNMTTEVWGKR